MNSPPRGSPETHGAEQEVSMTDGDVQHIEMQVLAGFLDAQRASVLAIVDRPGPGGAAGRGFLVRLDAAGPDRASRSCRAALVQRVTIDQLQCRDRPRAPGAPLRAPPVRVAIRAGPDGQARRLPCPGPLGELEPRRRSPPAAQARLPSSRNCHCCICADLPGRCVAVPSASRQVTRQIGSARVILDFPCHST